MVETSIKGYYVTKDGRVWSERSNMFIKPRVAGSGYLYVRLGSLHDGRVNKSVHRMVAIAYIDNPENKPCVNHIDGNKLNNDVSNLEWVTYSENLKHSHRVLKSHKPLNEAHPNSKLSSIQVVEIKRRLEQGEKPYSIAKCFGVDPKSIRNILHENSWKNIGVDGNVR